MTGVQCMSKDKRGFTLVEVIVVLLILAILAGIMVPSLTTYIDKANEKKLVADTRAIYVAAQTAIIEQYALNPDFGNNNTFQFSYRDKNNVDHTDNLARVTNNMLYQVQRNSYTGTPDPLSKIIAKEVLDYLDSSNRSTARYELENRQSPVGMKLSRYPSIGIIVYYDKSGQVIFVEFGKDGTLCHWEDGVITVTTGDDAKYSGSDD